jgi:hypothetical protein
LVRALPARDIFEISFIRGIRPVPRSPEIVAGLAEVHGRVVTLIDLERLLGANGGNGALEDGEATPAGAGVQDDPSRLGVVLAPPLDHLGILLRSDVDVASGGDLHHLPENPEEGGLLRARVPVGDRLLNLLFLFSSCRHWSRAWRKRSEMGLGPASTGQARRPDGDPGSGR